MQPDKVPTLQAYLPRLSERERALIVRAYNEWRTFDPSRGPEAHHGLLPFISMNKIGAALNLKASTAHEYRRIWAELASKVEAPRWAATDSDHRGHSACEMILINERVHHHFGPRPELGVTMPTIPKEETLGPLKWNVAKMAYIHEKISAAPRITLCKLRNIYKAQPDKKGRGVWVLYVPTRYKQLAVNWLQDHC